MKMFACRRGLYCYKSPLLGIEPSTTDSQFREKLLWTDVELGYLYLIGLTWGYTCTYVIKRKSYLTVSPLT